MSDLISVIRQCPPIDFQLFFETTIPCIVNNSSTTLVFQAMSTIMYFIGDIANRVLPPGESYKRLFNSREFSSLIQQLNLATMDKIPFIARIIHSFLGAALPEGERVRSFLEIKSILTRQKETPSVQSKSRSGTEFIFFLCSFNTIDEYVLHDPTYQFTIFHISECLTIMNSYKSLEQPGSLLLSSNASHSNITDSNSTQMTILSTADIPALEVSATLHILCSIIRSDVPLDHHVMTDIVDSALRIFFKVVIHKHCSSYLRKAYVNLVTSILETIPCDQPKDSMEYSLIKDLVGISSNLLKYYTDDTLRVGKY